MSTAPIPIDKAAAAANADVLDQIRSAYKTRQQTADALAKLEQQGADLQQSTVNKWLADVAAKGVDPATAVQENDAFTKAEAQITAQKEALKNLEKLVEARLEYFKKSNAESVLIVLREQITALGEIRKTQEKEEKGTQRQLERLIEELKKIEAAVAKP